jgi:nucleoside-diphosphate-sugar epimerase
MEAIIQELHRSFHIFRVSNLAGKTDNPHTVLNFFIQHIQSGDFFYVWKNAWRNIIDLADATAACNYIMQQQVFMNEIVNVANPVNYPVTTIVETIEDILGKKGNYELVDKSSMPNIDSSPVQSIFEILNIHFGREYLACIIKKYVGA